MKIAVAKPLFAWDALEDSPSLQTVRTFLEAIPDAPLIDSLQCARGRGRDDYPIVVLWGTLLLAVVLRHHSLDACLQRRPQVRPDGARQAGDRPASLPVDPTRHQEVLTVLQGPHIGGTGQRPAEDFFGASTTARCTARGVFTPMSERC